jgi:PhnB protein
MSTFFAPQLCVRDGAAGIKFYEKAFGAVEVQRWSNPDGTVHVAELSIDGILFHIRQETPRDRLFEPLTLRGHTTNIGLFVDDPNQLVDKAVSAGAQLLSPVQDYEYGYRQGKVADPFGHHWLIEKKI